MTKALEKFVNNLSEAERSFYVSSGRVHFTRGQEHVSFDITKCSPSDIARDLVGLIVVCNAMADLSRKLKREPSVEEVADEADDNAYEFGREIATKALHMGASDFRAIVNNLFPGLDKEAPKDKEDLDESMINEGFRVPDNELKMERLVRWYDSENDRIMHGQIVSVSATNVKVNDGKFGTDRVFTVDPDKIMRVSEPPKKEGQKPKVVWTRGL